jgi:hypothetical protein
MRRFIRVKERPAGRPTQDVAEPPKAVGILAVVLHLNIDFITGKESRDEPIAIVPGPGEPYFLHKPGSGDNRFNRYKA